MNMNLVGTSITNQLNTETFALKTDKNVIKQDVKVGNKENLYTEKAILINSVIQDENNKFIEKLDLVSDDYRRNMISSKSKASDGVLDPSESMLRLEEAYNVAKENIVKNLSGDEQEKKLSELDKAYKESSSKIINSFSSFTEIMIGQEKLFEKMRTMISEKVMFSDRLSKESQNMLKESYKRFDGIKNSLNILKEAVLNLHNKDNALTDILKLTNQITKDMDENLSKTYNIELKNKDEINKLNLEKAKLYDYNYKNMTDEEKYQQLAKDKKEIESIDKKLDKLVEDSIRQ